MKQIDPQEVDDIFYSALELPTEQRAQFLSENCGEADLRKEVEALLDSYHEEFLEKNVSVRALELISARLSPGDIVGGKYEILEMIGSGGMGEVYLAQDHTLNRKVAVKVLMQALSHDEKRVETFKQEACTPSQLNHRNIVTVFDFIVEGDTGFIIMEFIEGETLRQKLQSKTLDLSMSVEIACQLTVGLEAAHARGIVHRDIKPENVIISDDGHAIILDFGIASLIEQAVNDDGSNSKTLSRAEAATALGTASYMSPEQVRTIDDPAQQIDARSDIWSLGACLYEMLTGVRAFEGEKRIETFAAILMGGPTPIVKVIPDWLKAVVQKALQKNREYRYQTMAEFRRDLENPPQTEKQSTSQKREIHPFVEWRKTTGKRQWRILLLCAWLSFIISLAWAIYNLNLSNLSASPDDVVKYLSAWAQDAAKHAQGVGSFSHLILIGIAFLFFVKRPGPKGFRPIERDIKNGRLKPNITYSTGYKKESDWKTAREIAETALKSYREAFGGLLVAWFCLYATELFTWGLYLLELFGWTYLFTLFNWIADKDFMSSLLTQANNSNTLCIWLCFRILDEPIATEKSNETIRSDNKAPKKQEIIITQSFRGQIGLILTAFAIMVVWFIVELGITNSFEKGFDSIHQFSKLISGICGGVAMALFVGRFQSKFLKSPNQLIVILYLYTVIQVLFVFYGEETLKGDALTALVIHAALFLKSLLILYMFWLFQSGRLLFYLVRVRRAAKQVDSEWDKFREVLRER